MFFNEHQEKFFSPSLDTCKNKSMLHWYRLGGNWINIGLPMYDALNRKPEHGCEIQILCDGQNRIMLRLLLVKLQNSLFQQGGDSVTTADNDNKLLIHGTQD